MEIDRVYDKVEARKAKARKERKVDLSWSFPFGGKGWSGQQGRKGKGGKNR